MRGQGDKNKHTIEHEFLVVKSILSQPKLKNIFRSYFVLSVSLIELITGRSLFGYERYESSDGLQIFYIQKVSLLLVLSNYCQS